MKMVAIKTIENNVVYINPLMAVSVYNTIIWGEEVTRITLQDNNSIDTKGSIEFVIECINKGMKGE